MTEKENCFVRVHRTSAEFLMHGLRELGLNDGSLTLDDLLPVVEKIKGEHNLAAGDWWMLKECDEINLHIAFYGLRGESERKTEEIQSKRTALVEAGVLAPELAEREWALIDLLYERFGKKDEAEADEIPL